MELSVERIARAALDIVDEKGAGGFSLRAVADRLGVTPMALYHHVSDKAALAGHVIDLAMASDPLPDPTGVWRDDCIAFAHWMRDLGLRHPGLADIRRNHRVWTSSMLRLSDRWLGLWRQAGLSPDHALLAARASSLIVSGLVNEETAIRQMDRPDEEQLAMLPDARQLFNAKSDADDVFNLGVRAAIDGVFHSLSARTS